MDGENQPVADMPAIEPTLRDTEASVHPDRRLLIWVIILPYVVLCAAILGTILWSDIEQARITLAASAILAPLGTLAGGIVAYYFKAS
jgi:hypothetical protein